MGGVTVNSPISRWSQKKKKLDKTSMDALMRRCANTNKYMQTAEKCCLWATKAPTGGRDSSSAVFRNKRFSTKSKFGLTPISSRAAPPVNSHVPLSVCVGVSVKPPPPCMQEENTSSCIKAIIQNWTRTTEKQSYPCA